MRDLSIRPRSRVIALACAAWYSLVWSWTEDKGEDSVKVFGFGATSSVGSSEGKKKTGAMRCNLARGSTT